MIDRTVHAFNADRTLELVRYDRAGKWYIEPTLSGLSRQRVTIADAVKTAEFWWCNGGSPIIGQPGGSRFDALLDGGPKS